MRDYIHPFTPNTMKVLEISMKETQMPQLGGWGRTAMKAEFPTHSLTLGPNEPKVWTERKHNNISSIDSDTILEFVLGINLTKPACEVRAAQTL